MLPSPSVACTIPPFPSGGCGGVCGKAVQAICDQFGEDLVIELVELLNQMASDSRADLKALSDVNVERFEAKLDQRATEIP